MGVFVTAGRRVVLVVGVLVGVLAASFAITIAVALAADGDHLCVWAVNLSVPACLAVVSYLLIKASRRESPSSPVTRPESETLVGGCSAAVFGALAAFYSCFWIIPAGEGQLGCLLFP